MTSEIRVLKHEFLRGLDDTVVEEWAGGGHVRVHGPDAQLSMVGAHGEPPSTIISNRRAVENVTIDGTTVTVSTRGEDGAGKHTFTCASRKGAANLYRGMISGPVTLGWKTDRVDVWDKVATQTLVNGGNIVTVYPEQRRPLDVHLSGQEGHDVFLSVRTPYTDGAWALSDGVITCNTFASDRLGSYRARYKDVAASGAVVLGSHANVLLVATANGRELRIVDARTSASVLLTDEIKMKPTKHVAMCSDDDGRVFLLRSYGVLAIKDMRYTPESARLAYQPPSSKLNRDRAWYDSVVKIDVHNGKLLFVGNPPAWVRVDVPPLPWVADGRPGKGHVLRLPEGFGEVVDGNLFEASDDGDCTLAVVIDDAGKTAIYPLAHPEALPIVTADQHITAVAADRGDRSLAVGAVNARGLCEFMLSGLSLRDEGDGGDPR